YLAVTLLRTPVPTLVPYTTLFRSGGQLHRLVAVGRGVRRALVHRTGQRHRHVAGSINRQREIGRTARGRRRVRSLAGHNLAALQDRKSTRVDSRHEQTAYAAFRGS